MAHFAKLDANNIVTKVIVVDNRDVQDANGVEVESFGIAHCQKHEGYDSVWKKTSYNAARGQGYRGNFAGIGYTYMTNVATLGVGSTDIFIDQKPYPSWIVGVSTAWWYPPNNPGPAPELTNAEETAGKYYSWNESNYNSNPSTAWVLTTP